jgi:ABC-type branched-subunit amino acid transport system substrate-binding protein
LKNLPLAVLCLLSFAFARAQAPVAKPLKVAVFAPVYLDSVFSGDAYKLGKANLPRYILSGLDFYNGVMLAVDSLNKEKAPVEVLFYDSKTPGGLEQQLADTLMQDVSLIIASFNNREEIKPVADFALAKKIILISATYPNDGGIKENTSFVLINPTLTAHIEGLYRYVRKYYPLQTITWFSKKGETEELIESIFTSQNKKTGGTQVKLKTVSLSESFTDAEVLSNMDSSRQNIIICGSLNEAFGSNLSKALSSNKNFRMVAIGMPTWDGIRDISKDLEVVYSTPYNFSRTEKPGITLSEKYKNKYSGRATDMVYKGFESMYHFTKLLLKYGNAFASHLSDKECKVFNDFDIQPVKSSTDPAMTDYLENKKLYFIRKKVGMIRTVN